MRRHVDGHDDQLQVDMWMEMCVDMWMDMCVDLWMDMMIDCR